MAATAPPTASHDPFADDPRWTCLSSDPYPLLIGGELRQAVDGRTFEAVSSRTELPIARIAEAGPADVDAAVAAAREAFDNGLWGRTTARQRARALEQIARTIEEHTEELIFLSVIDGGSAISGFKEGTIDLATDALRFFGGQAMAMTGRVATMPDPHVTHSERLEPLGVVVEILPWNGPIWTGVQRMAAILAAGNTAIIKPAQMASLVFARIGQLIAELDLPPGVVNVLSGPGSTVGEALVAHPGVDMVSLTGGVESGTRILEVAASQVKRISLELGGKNPNIVLADADLDRAVMWSAIGAFGNSGQICVCGSRILVQRPIYDEFLARLKAFAEGMQVGDPLDPGTQLGPLISRSHAEKVWGYIEVGKREARLVTGGEPYLDETRAHRTYIPPTIFADAAPSCTVMREEIFGPVVSVLPFDTVDEALAIANDTTYGLSAGVFTGSVDSAEYVARHLKAGQVYVNQWFSPGVLEAPSQGYKQSGLGGVGMAKYMQSKNVFTRFTDPG
jgi:acyl-CoA reductase-like NAD-dependent aldehyde dehydrogenase